MRYRAYFLARRSCLRKMSTFVSEVSRTTGRMEWVVRDEDYDFQQEIARSSYADMLHDTERNQLYYKGLEKAIRTLRQRGKSVNVLDIGTGTGLLSMMAARLGADTVHACEAFKPMADCALKIIQENGFGEKIKVIPKRSTDVLVGKGQDMPCRANILVTEVFDTELIGEGAIGTFTHAHKYLLEKDCLVVPPVGNMYVQLVTSDLVRRWNQVDDVIVDRERRVVSPKSISRCGGAPSLHDLQLDQLPMETFTRLTDPIKVMRFDFSGKSTLPAENVSVVETSMLASGTVDGIFLWWDAEMDEEREIILSCAPRWAHPTPGNMQWRDHWMQAIYYPYTQLSVAKGDEVKVVCKHDEYSLWFDVAREVSKGMLEEDRPVCSCLAHVTYSRARMGMLSDPVRRKTYLNILRQHVTPETTCLCISDGSLLSLMAAQLGARHVFTVEPNSMCSRVVREFVAQNDLQDKVTVLDNLEDLQTQVDVVVGEPVFQTSLLPWDNLFYWYRLQELTNQMKPGAAILPGSMIIYGVAVEYEDLWKIRADVGDCEGFSIRQFDRLIQLTSDKVDEEVEPQPLWEYPCKASGSEKSLLRLDFQTPVDKTNTILTTCFLPVNRNVCCNGIALWAEFDFGHGHVISTGPQETIKIGQKVDWDYYTRQGVHLFYNNTWTGSNSNSDTEIQVTASFNPKTGDVAFKFHPKWS